MTSNTFKCELRLLVVFPPVRCHTCKFLLLRKRMGRGNGGELDCEGELLSNIMEPKKNVLGSWEQIFLDFVFNANKESLWRKWFLPTVQRGFRVNSLISGGQFIQFMFALFKYQILVLNMFMPRENFLENDILKAPYSSLPSALSSHLSFACSAILWGYNVAVLIIVTVIDPTLFRLTLKLVFEWIFSTSETRLVAIYPSKPVGYFFDAVEYLFCITILTGTKETTCEFFFGAYYAPQLKFKGALKLHVYSLRNAPKKSSLRQSVFNDCRMFCRS